jgi:hypothetical protein
LKKNKQHRIINTWNSLPENVISAKAMKIFEHRLDKYWKDQDLLYNYESNLTTGEEIEIDEEKELSIVVKWSLRLPYTFLSVGSPFIEEGGKMP